VERHRLTAAGGYVVVQHGKIEADHEGLGAAAIKPVVTRIAEPRV
jgi:hypothetical protein